MSRGFRDADSTQAMTDKATAETISKILEQDRQQASHSAERRARGDGGICEDCGRAIGGERLSALPTATRCVSCQAAREQLAV